MQADNSSCPGVCLFSALPQCPVVLSSASGVVYPSVFFTFAVTAIAALVFFCVVTCKYNSVRVFDHKIRTPSISNSLWIMFYLFIFLNSALNAVRYAVGEICLYPAVDWWFEGFTWSLHGVATFALCAALNHQRRFRSSGTFDEEVVETDPLLKRYSKIKMAFSWLDGVFLLMLIAYLVLVWVKMENAALKWVFLAAFIVQRIPALLLTILIVFFPKSMRPNIGGGTVTDEPSSYVGPSRYARTILFLATVLSAFGYIPLSLWALAFGQGCVFWIASWVDLLHLLYVLGLVLYFAFVRQEYLRLMEEAIWTNVSKFQATFNFSKF